MSDMVSITVIVQGSDYEPATQQVYLRRYFRFPPNVGDTIPASGTELVVVERRWSPHGELEIVLRPRE